MAFVVASAAGMDASGYSFPYVARWAKGDTDAIEATAEAVTRVSRRILDGLGDLVPAPLSPVDKQSRSQGMAVPCGS